MLTHRIMSRLGAWLKGRRNRRAAPGDLDGLDAFERDRVARDIGVSGRDPHVLAGKWPDSADLLTARVAMLGLDARGVARSAPSVMRDLQRVCAICASKGRCVHDVSQAVAAGEVPDCGLGGTFSVVCIESSDNSDQRVN